jgi:predicted AAA+ superfamily ATPase
MINMDPRFLAHNSHLDDPALFHRLDPQLRRLAAQPRAWRSPLIEELPSAQPGIYTLGGGRQVGKTTLAKQWMLHLLGQGVAPDRLHFLTGELLDDHHALVAALRDLVPSPGGPVRFIIVDDVTYIRGWDKGVKFLADAGLLEDVVLLLTGSDLAVIREARARFPGRRGPATVVDYHLYPLSFGATVRLVGTLDLGPLLDPEASPSSQALNALDEALQAYLGHGGYLTAINDVAREGRVRPSTLRIYSDWLRGDITKRGRSERYLREVVGAISRRLGSQVTWNALARELSIDHPKTVQDYVDLLTSMDAVFVQSALIEHRLTAAPKKARKVMFTDPFIAHAVSQWLQPVSEPWTQTIGPRTRDPESSSRLIEAVVATHFSRFFPTFYIKGSKGEIDVAFVHDGQFEPVEIKWRGRLRPSRNSQIGKYTNGRIWARTHRPATAEGVPVLPLARELLRLDQAGLHSGLGPMG